MTVSNIFSHAPCTIYSYLYICVVFYSVVNVGLEEVVYTVTEDGSNVSVCAVLSGDIERNVSITLSTLEDADAEG